MAEQHQSQLSHRPVVPSAPVPIAPRPRRPPGATAPPTGSSVAKARDSGVKKRKTTKACDLCRENKSKCSGGPRCDRCNRIGARCTFIEAPPKPDGQRTTPSTSQLTPKRAQSKLIKSCDECHNRHKACDQRDPCDTCEVAKRNCSYHKKHATENEYKRIKEAQDQLLSFAYTRGESLRRQLDNPSLTPESRALIIREQEWDLGTRFVAMLQEDDGDKPSRSGFEEVLTKFRNRVSPATDTVDHFADNFCRGFFLEILNKSLQPDGTTLELTALLMKRTLEARVPETFGKRWECSPKTAVAVYTQGCGSVVSERLTETGVEWASIVDNATKTLTYKGPVVEDLGYLRHPAFVLYANTKYNEYLVIRGKLTAPAPYRRSPSVETHHRSGRASSRGPSVQDGQSLQELSLRHRDPSGHQGHRDSSSRDTIPDYFG